MLDKVTPPKEIKDNEFVSLLYDEESKVLIQIWKGFVPSKIFREAIDESVAFSEKRPVKGILSNTIDQGVVSSDDTKYAVDTIPTLHKNGVQAMAFVIPENIFTKMSLKKFEKSSMLNITQYFMSIESAMEWIMNVIKE